ncbi:MAG TPA: RnfABCDGE type electron transport complex subunit D [Nitrospiria bacterium]|nr:RnfABCDGE type electron transport complex subunit D [Nitrospiria bacterium]
MAPEPVTEKKPQQPAAPPTLEGELVVSPWPHVKSPESIPRIMWSVVLALAPASLFSVYLFAWDAVEVIALCVASSLATEALCQRWMGRPITITDGSATVTGLLLALTLPPSSPWWMSILGGAIAIGIGKQIFGGLGYNIFNPALVARVVLLISFPLQMTTWHLPHPIGSKADVVTGATPLGLLLEGRFAGKGIGEAANVSLIDGWIGTHAGSLGETSVIALLIGGIFLLYRGYITWHIPVSMMGAAAAFAALFQWFDPTRYAGPMFHLLHGGMMIGAIYMATDMVSCPTTPRGQLLFGAGCGIIAMIIRTWGGYPEGVSFAIVMMNGVNPIIERYIQPKLYGERKIADKPH